MRFFLIALYFVVCGQALAQSLKDVVVSPSDNDKILSVLLNELEKKYNLDFVGDMDRLQALTVQGIEKPVRIMDYLDGLSGLFSIEKINDRIIVIIDHTLLRQHAFTKPQFVALTPQSAGRLTGRVTDALSESALVGAQVFLPGVQRGALTDSEGGFQVQDQSRTFLFARISYTGYDTENIVVVRSPYAKHNRMDVKLFQTSKELDGVTITADRINENVMRQISGVEKLSIATIKTVPTFMGEVDPIRSLTTLPGISTAGELSSGFNVRGGDVGQNLVLQDGAVIYNPSHLFGFFSAFNPDMVSDVALYKGNGPAHFGGRVASVLDVSLKKGDATRHTVTGGVGLVSSRLSAEGPLVKNKSSYMIGGRLSYCNWLLNATDNQQLNNSTAKFYDITAKLLHTINKNNFITLSVYSSHDAFRLETDSLFSWQTLNFSADWDHTFNSKMYSTLTLNQTNYYSAVDSDDEIEKFTYRNAIRGVGMKYDLTYALSEDRKLIVGIEGNGTQLEPGKLTPREGAFNVKAADMQDQRMIDGAVYAQADLALSEKLSVSAGLRYSFFGRFGNEAIYTYDYNNMDGRYPTISDTTYYTSGDVIQTYSGAEPRISIRYLTGANASIKASFYRGYQYMHLISNTTSTTPQDYWVASGPVLKPQIGNQYALGYFQNFSDNLYEFSVEGFYKNIEHAIDYMEGADITLNPRLEAGLVQGKGLAYGAEVFLKKTSGRFNGWLSYTYSRSLRQFDSANGSMMINGGSYFASAFDQPHIASLLLNYRVGQRCILSANFRYNTGRPITIPVSKFPYDVYLSVLNYSERNEYRIPDYHRLDLSFTVKDKPHKLSRFRSELVFSVFNVYGRRNAYSITFDRYGMAKKLSILGSVFPSVSYNFSF